MLTNTIKKLFISRSFLYGCILFSLLIVMPGCSQKEQMVRDQQVQADQVIVEKNDTIIDKKSVDSIEHVLTSEFTSPKQKYNKIIQNPKNLTIVDGEKAVKASNGSELYEYVEDLYKPFFTTTGFEKFFVSSAFRYTLQSKDIHIKVDDISIKRNKEHDKDYNFVINIKYQKKGNLDKQYKIKGIATLPEKGKISEIKYLDDEGLMKHIRKNS